LPLYVNTGKQPRWTVDLWLPDTNDRNRKTLPTYVAEVIERFGKVDRMVRELGSGGMTKKSSFVVLQMAMKLERLYPEELRDVRRSGQIITDPPELYRHKLMTVRTS